MGYSSRRQKISAGRRKTFLAALAAGDTVTAASQKAGVARTTVYDWRASDSDFADQWTMAEEAGTDLLEEEAVRRAREGIEKPVFRGGEIVGHVREYSDAMLMFLLKARNPDRFKDKKLPDTADFDLKGIRHALERKFLETVADEPAKTVSDEPDGC